MFRKSDDARYVGLCMPHVLMRLPYGKDTAPVEEFEYEENVDGRDHSKYLWGNAAYAFAARLTDAFARHEWCAAIRGVEGGGLVEGLPAHTFITDDGDVATKCPTEIAITDRREKRIGETGLHPTLLLQGHGYSSFHGRPIRAKTTTVSGQRCERQFSPVGTAAIYLRLLSFRAFPEGHDA
jgi:type VI secretion system protein ImpC